MSSKNTERKPFFKHSEELFFLIREIEEERHALLKSSGKFLCNRVLGKKIWGKRILFFLLLIFFINNVLFIFFFFLYIFAIIFSSFEMLEAKLNRSSSYTEAILLILEDFFSELEYDKDGSVFDIYQAEFTKKFPKLSVKRAEDLVTGKINEIDIAFGEILCRDLKRYFCFVADFNKHLESETVLMPISNKFLPQLNKSSLKKIVLENQSFNKRWQTFCKNEIEARYILTPKFMEKMANISTIFSGYFLFQHNKIIFLGHFKDKEYNLFDIELTSATDQNTIADSADERQKQKRYIYQHLKETHNAIYQLTSIVNELNLNTIIWK